MKSRHDGDCMIYAAVHNGMPFHGICTCGYGHQHMVETGGEDMELMSEERWAEVQASMEYISDPGVVNPPRKS